MPASEKARGSTPKRRGGSGRLQLFAQVGLNLAVLAGPLLQLAFGLFRLRRPLAQALFQFLEPLGCFGARRLFFSGSVVELSVRLAQPG